MIYNWLIHNALPPPLPPSPPSSPCSPPSVLSRGVPKSEKKLPWHYVTKRNSISRPLITCASVRCRAWRNTLPRIRLIGTGNSCLTEACAFMPWWQTRAAPFLWTCSCATEWSLLVFMMAGMEIHCPWAWQTWVAPSTSPALLLSSWPFHALHQ